MPAVAECEQVLKGSPHLQIPGFGESELSRSVCKALNFVGAVPGSRLDNMLATIRKSFWDEPVIQTEWGRQNPTLNKAVEGGLRHVMSVDNAAGYAELWTQGGSWYMVTGADPENPSRIMLKNDNWKIYEIPGMYPGMRMEEASAYWLGKMFGPQGVARGGCGCGGRN